MLKHPLVLIVFTLATAPALYAQTVYVTDQLQIGLHADQGLESPIVAVVASGTALDLVKQEQQLSFVREPGGGISGWVDNSYLISDTTSNAKLREAQARITTLEQSLAETSAGDMGLAEQEHNRLQTQLEEARAQSAALRTRAEALQAELASRNTDSLYTKIDELADENEHLQQRLGSVLEVQDNADPDISANSKVNNNDLAPTPRLLIGLALAILAGLALGVYLMDLISRKRHGGFRI